MLLIDFLKNSDVLTPHQTQVLSKRLESKHGDLEITKIIELSFAQEPKCPRCPRYDDPALMRWPNVGGSQRYRCRSCTRTFNRVGGTPLARPQLQRQMASICRSLESCINYLRISSSTRCAQHLSISLSDIALKRCKKTKEQHRFWGISEAMKCIFSSHKKAPRVPC